MKFLVLVLVAGVSAAPLGYNLPTGSGSYFHNGICRFGQVRHLDGRCVTPQVYQRSYVYDAPRKVNYFRRPHYIPEPKVERNVVFVRLPEDDLGPEPIIVPPPRQQQVVYVLNKQSEQDQRVIEVPAPPPTEPEVVFVDYEEGENPILPSGEDLHSALNTASQGFGHVVGSSGVANGHALTNSIGGDFGVGIGDFNPITNHHSTHTSHHSTHTNHHSTPTSQQSIHINHHSTPTNHYTTPASYYITPTNHYSTPSSHYTTPRSYYSTPASHYTTPRSYYSTTSIYTLCMTSPRHQSPTSNMKFLVLVLVAGVSAAPLGYNLPTGSGSYFHNGICRFGQVRHLDGRCVTPQVYQRSYVYDAPRKVNYFRRPHYIPEPKVERNVVFVRLPEDDLGPEPIIVPPPRQQQVVYVLNKQSEQDQRVIEVPAPPPTEPEVVFVDYEEGENPILPSGEDLHSALNTASQGFGHVVGSSGVANGHALTNSIGGDFGVGIGDFNPITNHHSTHTSHHSTHTNHHSTPTSQQSIHINHHSTPTSHYTTPASYHITPTSHYSTPSSHYTTPRSYYSTPASHYTTPRSYYSTPASHYTTPRSYYSTPASHYTTPSSLYTTP
ncbi:uncharacterized protein LOC122242401 [Penaeus japonicus]|uniref:uncharacterized protein LOC122242401 n=1 Tax=Penaeus japonicus TaxID=27405 RepID=UPI001C717607|nr:uncharacterized protein LOC122242401 [Penaeus japonicus]